MADPTLSDIKAILVRMELRQRQHTALLNYLRIGEQIMSQEMDQLVSAVETNTTVDQSVLTFLQGVAQQITDAAGDRAKSLQLAATVKASTDAVTAALLANTPAAPVG
jgi:hypothetical protein